MRARIFGEQKPAPFLGAGAGLGRVVGLALLLVA